MNLDDHYRDLNRARQSHDREGEAHALLNLGKKLQESGELDRAGRMFRDGLTISDETLVSPETVAHLLLSLGEVQRDARRTSEARTSFTRQASISLVEPGLGTG